MIRRSEITNFSRSVYACCQNGSFDLPNRLFSRLRDRVRDRVRIEIVVQRVVADAGVETDLEVVRLAIRGRAASAAPAGRSRLSLRGRGRRLSASGSSRAPAQQLIDVRIHARGRLSGADGAENHHAGVEPALRNRQPRRGRARGPACARNALSPSTSVGVGRDSGSGYGGSGAQPRRPRVAIRDDRERRTSRATPRRMAS